MKIYSKICAAIFNILKWLVAIILVFIVCLTFVEVIRRYFFHQNWIWSEVLVRYLIVWCTFMGGAAAYRVGSLTRFDVITQKLSRKAQLALELICTIVIICLSLWLTRRGIESFNKPSIANQISLELGISMKWIYLSIPVGFASIVIFGIEKLAETIAAFKTSGSEISGKESENA